MFSGITNDDAWVPSSHSMTEESRRDERQRQKNREGEGRGAGRGEASRKEGAEDEVNRKGSCMVITHVELTVVAVVSALI